MPGDLNMTNLQELEDSLAALNQISDADFLDLIRENLLASIPKASYTEGRTLEYMAERLKRMIEKIKTVETS